MARWSDILSPNMPFLAFTHVQEDRRTSPCRGTLRRLHLDDGSQTYRHLIYSARRST